MAGEREGGRQPWRDEGGGFSGRKVDGEGGCSHGGGTSRSLKAASPKSRLPIRGASLGGWLLTEKWTCPSLWDQLEEQQLLDGARVQLQSTEHGAWLQADGGGGADIVASGDLNGWWETFVIWRMPSGRVKLRASDGHFVALSGGWSGRLHARESAPEDAAEFAVARCPYDATRVRVVASSGFLVEAAVRGEPVVAVTRAEETWEDGPGVFRMVAEPVMQGDFALCNALGPRAAEVMEKHWQSYITEADIESAARSGLNALRVPIGWWIACEVEPPWPYVGGGARHLDRAFDWAQKYGLGVLVDLHAVPGSCNGWDLGGSRDGAAEWEQPENVEKTLRVVEWLVRRYHAHPALLGFELMNEPRRYISKAVLREYYERSYQIVRSFTEDALIVVATYIDGDSGDFADFFEDPTRWKNTIVDIGHWYSSYTGRNKPASYYIDGIFRRFRPIVDSLNRKYSIPTLVGEWSLELGAAQPPAEGADYEKFAEAQVEVWGTASAGWFFYTLKTETPWNSDCWSFRQTVDNGWLKSSQWGGSVAGREGEGKEEVKELVG